MFLGTIVNAAAVVAGGLLGLLFKKGMKPSLEESIHKALGVAVLVLGLNGIISSMFTVSAEGKPSSSGELLLIVSLVLGMLAGELLRIDERLNSFGRRIEQKVGTAGFAASFVNGTLIFCVGAMTIVGALNDGLYHDPSILYVKSMLDAIGAVVFGATLGVGVCFCAIPILLYEGGLTLLAGPAGRPICRRAAGPDLHGGLRDGGLHRYQLHQQGGQDQDRQPAAGPAGAGGVELYPGAFCLREPARPEPGTPGQRDKIKNAAVLGERARRVFAVPPGAGMQRALCASWQGARARGHVPAK